MAMRRRREDRPDTPRHRNRALNRVLTGGCLSRLRLIVRLRTVCSVIDPGRLLYRESRRRRPATPLASRGPCACRHVSTASICWEAGTGSSRPACLSYAGWFYALGFAYDFLVT